MGSASSSTRLTSTTSPDVPPRYSLPPDTKPTDAPPSYQTIGGADSSPESGSGAWFELECARLELDAIRTAVRAAGDELVAARQELVLQLRANLEAQAEAATLARLQAAYTERGEEIAATEAKLRERERAVAARESAVATGKEGLVLRAMERNLDRRAAALTEAEHAVRLRENDVERMIRALAEDDRGPTRTEASVARAEQDLVWRGEAMRKAEAALQEREMRFLRDRAALHRREAEVQRLSMRLLSGEQQCHACSGKMSWKVGKEWGSKG
jgi:hypothetical protein